MVDVPGKRLPRWYFGGLAAAAAVCFTHPLDLIKVHLQTQQEAKHNLAQITGNIIKNQGAMGLYCGLSASVVRQLIYSTTRFGIYEIVKQKLPSDAGFGYKIVTGGMAGAFAGFLGAPTDIVNVRMQNDFKLPEDQRRNYKQVFDGLWRIHQEEGASTLFKGASTASGRACLMGIGQLAFYDIIKAFMLTFSMFSDNLVTHFNASFIAGAIATAMSQPVDVVKTRFMNAKPGEYEGIKHVITHTAQLGPMGFFKGYVPAFIRNGPQTVLTFIFFEQLRLHYGFVPVQKKPLPQ